MSEVTFDRLMRAIRNHDRADFLSNATDDMRRAVTPELMDQITRDLAPHLTSGFERTHLGEAEEQGFTVGLWKVAFHDGSDDVVLQVATRGDQLAGFFRQ